MADWTHVNKLSGDEGLAVGVYDSEVTVSSSDGTLYQKGTALSATATELNVIDGANTNGTALTAITAGKLMTMGSADIVGSDTIDSGLTTIDTVVASLGEAATTISSIVTAVKSGTTVSSFILSVWGYEGGTTASTETITVNYVVTGTK